MALISFIIMMTATILLGSAQWSPVDMRLTWNDRNDWMPSIAQASNGKIWVVWHSPRTGNNDIFYKVYDSSQVHPWSSDQSLTTDPNADIEPSIMRAKDGKLWVVWATNRNGNYDIFYKTSSDNGTTWSSDGNLVANPNVDMYPSLMQTKNGTIWLTWSTNRTGNDDIYYKTSNDNGTSWSSDKQLTTAEEDDWDPSIMQDSDNIIWVVWVKNDIIFYKKSPDNGTSWYGNEALTNNGCVNWHPSIMQDSDRTIWIVWDLDTEVQSDLYYKSMVYGGTWSWETKLTTDGADDAMPSIMQAMDEYLWVVWTSSRLDNYDIYYKTTRMPSPHDVSIFSVIPSTTVAYQGKKISIEVVAQNNGTNPETFNVTCYVVGSTQLGNERISLAPGQLYPIIFQWNTSTTTRGTYTINATASIVTGEFKKRNNFMTTTVRIKLLGDVNDDGKVDTSDLFDLGNAYGSDPSKPNWNPDCDFNSDNKVDDSDLSNLSKNYGTSQ